MCFRKTISALLLPKGLDERIVLFRHALKNAFLPVITIIGIQAGTLMAGAVLTETIFAWPGIGKWVYDAILGRDYPIVQGGTLLIAIIFVFFNLLGRYFLCAAGSAHSL